MLKILNEMFSQKLEIIYEPVDEWQEMKNKDENVTDVDFEEVDDDKK